MVVLFLLCLLLAGIVAVELWYPQALVHRLQETDDETLLALDIRTGEKLPDSDYKPPGETAFSVIERRPLFMPTRRPPEGEPLAGENGLVPTTSLEGLILTGIVGFGEDRISIVEPRAAAKSGEGPLSLRAGDELRGWTVAAIEEDRIILVNGAARTELVFVDDAARRRQTMPRRQSAPGVTPLPPRQPVITSPNPAKP